MRKRNRQKWKKPMTNMGRVKISSIKPLGQPVNSWMMIADPDTPPGAMLNGALINKSV